MKRWGMLLFAVVVFSGIMFSSHIARAAEIKFGYVDVAKVFDDYEKTKANDRELQELGKAKENERDSLVKDIRALKDELLLLSDDAKEKKQEALDEKVRELRDFDNAAKQELGEKRHEYVRMIFKDIDDVVQSYGERKGFDMILNERALIYRNEGLDVTEEVLKELNKLYKKG